MKNETSEDPEGDWAAALSAIEIGWDIRPETRHGFAHFYEKMLAEGLVKLVPAFTEKGWEEFLRTHPNYKAPEIFYD